MEDSVLTDSLTLDYETTDEANNLLENGILVETPQGFVCMSVNDALSSDLSLSVEQLQKLATHLLRRQNVESDAGNSLSRRNFNSDSDGFSSECSDVCSTSSSAHPMIPPKAVSLSFSGIKSDSSGGTPFLSSVSSELSANSCISDSDVSIGNNTVESFVVKPLAPSVLNENKPAKRRGGWPKGRKRKPELLNLPPKAPATGYNLFLNEQRKFYKDTTLAFHEITKIIGNKWSNLSLEAKKPYLMKAEEDKKRYREELKAYRQSDAYRAYMAKKRLKRLQNNVLSESDMDATDEIDEEDNEELYCRTCDQWFHNLHNKREHLQGKQHIQSVAGDIRRELELDSDNCVDSNNRVSSNCDDSSIGAASSSENNSTDTSISVSESILSLINVVKRREKDMKILENQLQQTILSHNALGEQLSSLKERENKLKNDFVKLKEQEKVIEDTVFKLWKVPSLFIVTDFNDFNNYVE